MLLCCLKDLYRQDQKTIIFTSGKLYRAIYGKYRDSLTEEELDAFKKISQDYPYIEEMLEWNVIRSINDFKEPWIIEIIDPKDKFNHANQFKNEHFIQVSSFTQGLRKNTTVKFGGSPMQFYKAELLGFIKYLDTLELAGQASRMRTKFKNILIELYLEFEEDYKQILEDFKNDEDREKELRTLLSEIVGVNDDDSTHHILISLKHSILTDSNTHKGDEAQLYDRLCDLFESIPED